MIQIFSKLVNFGPHILTFLESFLEGLQATKIFFMGQSSEAKKLLGDQILVFGPDFPKIGEFCSTYF